MKYLYVLLSVFFPLTNIFSQEIVVQKVSKNPVCVGDTVWVSYTSTLILSGDAFFAAQISDATGSFASFTNIGHNISENDSIPVVMKSVGDHFKLRVIATEPYTISSNTSAEIHVLKYPSPNPIPLVYATSFGYTALLEDSIKFTSGSSQTSGSDYLWTFDQSANIAWTTTATPTVKYNSTGKKTGSLSISNSAGCPATGTFSLNIISCTPVIPDNVHIVTGTESGNFPYVWVKAGGNFTVKDGFGTPVSIVFAEPGSSIQGEPSSLGYYYIKTGTSFTWNNSGNALIILNRGNVMNFNDHLHYVDTLYCDDLQFDYSQVVKNEIKQTENPLKIFNSSNNLRINCDGEMISTYIVNLLGKTIISKIDRDMISFDLSSLNNGVYFAVITSGDHREVRKLTIVH